MPDSLQGLLSAPSQHKPSGRFCRFNLRIRISFRKGEGRPSARWPHMAHCRHHDSFERPGLGKLHQKLHRKLREPATATGSTAGGAAPGSLCARSGTCSRSAPGTEHMLTQTGADRCPAPAKEQTPLGLVFAVAQHLGQSMHRLRLVLENKHGNAMPVGVKAAPQRDWCLHRLSTCDRKR